LPMRRRAGEPHAVGDEETPEIRKEF
jgi:hypothetical protein